MRGFLQALLKLHKLGSCGHAVTLRRLSLTHRDDLNKHRDPARVHAYICGGQSSSGNWELTSFGQARVTAP